MWEFAGLNFILVYAGSPVGIGVVFFAFLVSCLVRVLSRSNWSIILYRVISCGILFYLGCWTAVLGDPEWESTYFSRLCSHCFSDCRLALAG